MKKINFLSQFFIVILSFFSPILIAIAPRSSGLLQCFKLKNIAERQGCQTIILLKQAIVQLERKITNIKGKTGSERRIMTQIKEKNREIEEIKKKFDIEPLEVQKKLLEEQQRKIAYKTYGLATQSFKKLNNLYSQITEDRQIKEIAKEMHRLELEAKKRTKEIVKKMRQVGKNIVQQTETSQAELNKFKQEKLIPLEQDIKVRLLASDVDQEIDKIEIQILELKNKLSKEHSLSLTPQENKQIIQLEDIIARLKVMDNFINNPEEILDISTENILGLSAPHF